MTAAFIIFRSHGVVAACIGMGMLGASYNVDFCYHLIYYPMLDHEKNETIVSILTFIMGGGPFVAGYLITTIVSLTSISSFAGAIPILICLNVIGFVFALIQNRQFTREF